MVKAAFLFPSSAASPTTDETRPAHTSAESRDEGRLTMNSNSSVVSGLVTIAAGVARVRTRRASAPLLRNGRQRLSGSDHSLLAPSAP
jgi:hypothetical protein